MRNYIICLFVTILSFVSVNAQNTEKLPSYFSNNNVAAETSFKELLPTTGTIDLIKESKSSIYNTNYSNLLHVEQIGVSNSINVSSKVGSQQEIIQKGNKNLYSYKDYLFDSPMSLKIMQRGDASTLRVFGANKLLNGAEIYQSKGSKVTISNF